MSIYSMGKIYKLKEKRVIEKIVYEGNKVFYYPFLVKWIICQKSNKNAKFRFAISISKNKIKSAVKRNKIKRYIREVIRQNKNFINNRLKLKGLCMLIIYISSSVIDYKTVKQNFSTIIEEILFDINTTKF